MNKQEKAIAILGAFVDGFSVYAKVDGKQLDVKGVAIENDKIFGFVKTTDLNSDADKFVRVDITDAETFRYFLEPICGATQEESTEQKNTQVV